VAQYVKQPTRAKPRAVERLLAKGMTVSRACQKVGTTRANIYAWRAKYMDFAIAWDDGFEIGNDTLEDIILDHAAKDWRAAQALLKASRPATWWPKRVYIDPKQLGVQSEGRALAEAQGALERHAFRPALVGQRGRLHACRVYAGAKSEISIRA
jgi:transposase-like protein